jgi:hypothetical protein
MASLLYVTCNVRSQTRSRTLSLGYEFLEEYREALSLFRENARGSENHLKAGTVTVSTAKLNLRQLNRMCLKITRKRNCHEY